MEIERTGRKRRRKRLLIALTVLGALGLAGLTVHFVARTPPQGARAATPERPVVPQGPVTFDEADAAVAEAESLQTLVATLGEAVAEAGLMDLSAFNMLLNQAVGVVSAANEMLDAVDLGAEDAAKSARNEYHRGLDESRESLELVMGQLKAAGVDVARLRQSAEE